MNALYLDTSEQLVQEIRDQFTLQSAQLKRPRSQCWEQDAVRARNNQLWRIVQSMQHQLPALLELLLVVDEGYGDAQGLDDGLPHTLGLVFR